jgi:hypothetical protein
MDMKDTGDRITFLKARMFELEREKEGVTQELFIQLGKAQALAEVEAKMKAELEAQAKVQPV